MPKSKKFEFRDLDENMSLKEKIALLTLIRKTICPDAVMTIRHTTGTDFPPFWAIESKEYFNNCDENEFELIEKVEI